MMVLSWTVLAFLVAMVIGQSNGTLMEEANKSALMTSSHSRSFLKCGTRPLDTRRNRFRQIFRLHKQDADTDYSDDDDHYDRDDNNDDGDKSDILDKIVGGERATYGEFPWHVSVKADVYVPGEGRGILMCGATILNEYWILSAAHCFQHPINSYTVTVGDHDWSKPDRAEQTFHLEKIINHERYEGGSNNPDHDIALIKIKQSANGQGIQFNDYIQPVCLPDSTTSYADGTRCIVSGWGRTKDPAYDRIRGVLMKTELELVGRRTCQLMHFLYRITDRMMCAGDLQGHTSTCNGDSGGGLVYRNRGAYTLLGVVSWGAKECNVPNKPGVFAHVLNLLPWIKSNLERYSDNYEESLVPGRP